MVHVLMRDKAAGNLSHAKLQRSLQGFERKTGLQQESGFPVRDPVGITRAAGAEALNVDHQKSGPSVLIGGISSGWISKSISPCPAGSTLLFDERAVSFGCSGSGSGSAAVGGVMSMTFLLALALISSLTSDSAKAE